MFESMQNVLKINSHLFSKLISDNLELSTVIISGLFNGAGGSEVSSLKEKT